MFIVQNHLDEKNHYKLLNIYDYEKFYCYVFCDDGVNGFRIR